MNKTLPPHTLYWGRRPRWQPNLTTLAELPTDTRMVLVDWDGLTQHTLEALRQRLPRARLLALLPAHALGTQVQQALQLGFDDVAVGDEQAELRLKFWHQLWDTEDKLQARYADHANLVALVNEVAAKPGLSEVLRTTVLRLSALFSIARASVVMLRADHEVGFLVTQGEHAPLDNVVIRLSDYPEFLDVIQRCAPLVVSNQLASALITETTTESEGATWPQRSAALFPLLRRDQVVGVLFLRGHDPIEPPYDRLMQIGEFIAGVTSVALSNALEQDILLSAQRELIRKQADAQQELLNLRQFSDVFEQSFDGILITGADGRIRYANQSAGAILQRKLEQLRGDTFFTLLSPHSVSLAHRAFSGDSVGDAYGHVDLVVGEDRDGETIISAAIRPLAENGGVLIIFRDVTELREIESELRHTKEVLENLIQSCTDAVAASNVDGRIILFNRAAETLLGYRAREVVGRQGWEVLFKLGEDEDMLRRLRSDGSGGRGRLEMRRDLIDKDGKPVAVNLSASCVYEGEREVAVVAVFTDLRPRLEIEARLTQAQQRLGTLEAEVALMGQISQAVHDLSQPLTAIMGYASMLEQGNPKALEVTARELRRVVGLVKHLRRLTSPQARAGQPVESEDA